MNYLPYRDESTNGKHIMERFDKTFSGDDHGLEFKNSGNIVLPVESKKRVRKPWVYKEDYDRALKNMNLWKKAFQISFWINCAVIFGELFGSWIINKVGTDIIFIAFGVAFVVTWGYSLHKQYKERKSKL